MAPIRLGFIGLSTQGWASQALVPPLFTPLLAPHYTLTALCTRSAESATATAEKYSALAGRKVKAYYGPQGPMDLARDPEVDMVAVSVKIPDHFVPVLQAIEAGKDVFIEWAPGKNYEETVKIAEAAKKKGVRVLVGAQGNHGIAIKKIKELVNTGKIGKVVSTTMLMGSAEELGFWGRAPAERGTYGLDINNGVTMLSIPIGHFIAILDDILGPFAEVTASGTIRYPTGHFVTTEGKPTNKVFHSTVHDQISLAGILKDGVFVSIHSRSGIACTGSRGAGRRRLQWIIDGEDGTIELTNRESEGLMGSFMGFTEKDVFLNGEKVVLEETEVDQLGNSGKAWLEFAKGEKGKYLTMDDAVRIHRVLDAALTSITEGKKVVL